MYRHLDANFTRRDVEMNLCHSPLKGSIFSYRDATLLANDGSNGTDEVVRHRWPR